MENYDWTRFTKRINIMGPLQEVYAMWSSQQKMESWFLRLCEFSSQEGVIKPETELAIKGDKYKWHWHGWPDTNVEHGEILEANGRDTFAFTFGGPVDNPMRVTVHLTSELGETIVSITQENIPTDEKGKTSFHLGCGEGWTFYLANLKSICMGGVDLRNKNLQIGQVINSCEN